MPSTCLGCGCACDDIVLTVQSDRIVDAHNACSLGLEWFGDGRVAARTLVHGRAVGQDEALDTAARLLGDARRPLVCLAPDISCEAQRAAIELADVLHAAIDSVTSTSTGRWILAGQELGCAAATLGEIRNRADVVVFWGVDPAQRYPRFWTRYAPEPQGTHIPDGRRSRTVVAVDVGSSRGPADADVRVELTAAGEVATLTALTAAVRADDDATGLLQTLLRGTYVAIVADAEAGADLDTGRAAALIAFAQALNGPTRSALVTLRGGGNRTGADACLTAQTGYPMAVDFARGVPQYRPFDSAAARLSRGSSDIVLVVGAAARLPAPLLAGMTWTAAVLIGPRASEVSGFNAVAVDTGVVGIHERGTALRMDDVPLALEAALPGPPSTADMVRALTGRLTAPRIARPSANRQ